jgi:hypothetical protein
MKLIEVALEGLLRSNLHVYICPHKELLRTTTTQIEHPQMNIQPHWSQKAQGESASLTPQAGKELICATATAAYTATARRVDFILATGDEVIVLNWID